MCEHTVCQTQSRSEPTGGLAARSGDGRPPAYKRGRHRGRGGAGSRAADGAAM